MVMVVMTLTNGPIIASVHGVAKMILTSMLVVMQTLFNLLGNIVVVTILMVCVNQLKGLLGCSIPTAFGTGTGSCKRLQRGEGRRRITAIYSWAHRKVCVIGTLDLATIAIRLPVMEGRFVRW